MSERLADRHGKRVQEGARKYLDRKRMLRDFVGPGGVKLTRVEQQQLYKDALDDPDMMLGIIQNRQQQNKVPPDQLPWDFVRWIERMEAMGATERPPAGMEGSSVPNTP